LRRRSHERRTLPLPPVLIVRSQRTGFSGAGPRRTWVQSASSSSARIIASAVVDPWPISERSMVSVTTLSRSIETHALGANGWGVPLAASSARAQPGGR